MPRYCRCEAYGGDTIDHYMNKCHCEGFFSIDLNRSNNDNEKENLEETIIGRNTCIYDSNNARIFHVGDTVMNIENVME